MSNLTDLRKLSRLSIGSKCLLIVAILFHLSLLVSWRMGVWNRFTFDSTVTHGERGWDFFALYQAGHNVLTGVSAYESDNEKIDVVAPRYTPFRYLPVSAYTVGLTLSLIPPLWAFRLWVAVIEGLLLGCVWLSWRLGRDPDESAILASMWLLFSPYYLEIYLGQFSLVQGCLIYLLILQAQQGHIGRSFDRIWLASILWKQNTALFGPLFVRLGRWRGLLLTGAAVVLTSLPYFILVPGSLAAFAQNLNAGTPGHQLGNLGVRQLLYSILSALAPALDSQAHMWIQGVWVALVVVVGLLLTWRHPQPDIPLLLALWTTSYFMIYHHVWEHHYVMLLPVFALLYHRTRARGVLLLWAVVAIWTPYILIDPQGIAGFHAPMRWTPLEPRWIDGVYHASKALPTCLLWGYTAHLIARGHPKHEHTTCSPC